MILNMPVIIPPIILNMMNNTIITMYQIMRFPQPISDIFAMHKKKFTSLINTTGKFDWMKFLKGAGIWTALMVALTFIPILTTASDYQITFNPKTFGLLLILSFITFPLQASFEEIFFRGYLMKMVLRPLQNGYLIWEWISLYVHILVQRQYPR